MLRRDEMVDKFRVLRLLGKGGMGEVYLARDSVLGRKVALKVVNATHLGSVKSIRRFVFEARTTAQFNHPHIVTVFAAGEHKGNPYLALEYLEGQSLRQRLREQRPSLRESLRFGLAIADALDEAHRNNILHRDLKPENVFIPRDGRLRVLDFGLAKSFGQGALPSAAELSLAVAGIQEPTVVSRAPDIHQTLSDIDAPGLNDVNQDTVNEIALDSSWVNPEAAVPVTPPEEEKRNVIVGTPTYIAPEQWLQQEATSASDIWALGVVLYELIAGRRPYMDREQAPLAFKVTAPEPAPLISDFVEVPRDVADLVAACLEKDPTLRPKAEEIKSRLDAMISKRSKQRNQEASPFRGLQAFSERHADFFFGRDAEVASFLERIREDPVLPIVGPSGAGKSSFVQAGIIPRLREQSDWTVLLMRPGSQPFSTLAMRLVTGVASNNWNSSVLEEPTLDKSPRRRDRPNPSRGEQSSQASSLGSVSLREDLQRNPLQLSMVLQQIAEETGTRVLLFVDQLEELYTLVEDETTRRSFMLALATAADDPMGPVRVIFTLRDDFLGRLALGPEVREVLSRVTVIRTPQARVLEDILLRPLEATGYCYDDPGLVAEMVNAVKNEPSCLPLLQFATQTLWERRDREQRLLCRAQYEMMGGVGGALAEHADGVLAGLSPQQLSTARDLLLRLVTAEGTRRVISRANLLEGLDAEAEQVLDRFTASRLVSVRKSSRRADGGATLELVHESLIRNWARLSHWVDESREDLGFIEELQQATELWLKRGKRDDEVWRGGALRDALRFQHRSARPLAPEVQNFLLAGDRRERRAQRRRRLAVSGLAIVALTAAIMAAAFFEQRNKAKERSAQLKVQWSEAQLEGARAALLNEDLVEARAKVRGSLEAQDSTLGRALWWKLQNSPLLWRSVLGTEIYKGALSADGKRAAVAGQDRTVHLFDVVTGAEQVLRGSEAQIISVNFSHDSSMLAAGTDTGEIRIWDLNTGKAKILKGHQDVVWSLRFCPDDSMLASASWDMTVRQWNVASGSLLRVLKGHKGKVWGVDYSPNGKYLVSSSDDKTLRIWDLVEDNTPKILRGHQAAVPEVHFSPDGNSIISGGADDTIRTWDVSSGRQLRMIKAEQNRVRTVIFGEDGKTAYSGGGDASIVHWDLRSGRALQRLREHQGPLSSLDLSDDGKLLLSTASDKNVKLWRTDILRAPDRGQGHESGVLCAAFSPDGKLLASGSYDASVRLWDVRSGAQIAVLTGHNGDIYDLAFSPDGKILASASYDRSLRLWDVDKRQTLRVLEGHKSSIFGLAFSPDGKQLASTGTDKTLRFWQVNDGRLTKTITNPAWLNGVAYSPDGKQVAAGSEDHYIYIWDVSTGRLRSRLQGHSAGVVTIAYSPDGTQLISGDDKGALRLWDLGDGSSQPFGEHSRRVYRVAFSPQGDQIASTSADGRALLWGLDAKVQHALQGHSGEINHIAYSTNGKQVVTSGDDGTVRLWDSATGQPFWRGPALLKGPGMQFSHQGWQPLDGNAKTAAQQQWQRAIAERAQSVAESDDGKRFCLLGFAGQVELWSMAEDRQLFQASSPQARLIVATQKGCAVSGPRMTTMFNGDGQASDFPLAASALCFGGGRLFVASGTTIFSFGDDGGPAQSYGSDAGMSALLYTKNWLVVGYHDGSIELLSHVPKQARPGIVFKGVPSSPVSFLRQGPMGTLLAGFGGGAFGAWQLDSGTLLHRAGHLHGAITHMVLRGGQLHVSSDLGMHTALDFRVFDLGRCPLLRQVWAEDPIIWMAGRPIAAAPNPSHLCAKGFSVPVAMSVAKAAADR